MKIKCNNCKDVIEGDKKGTYKTCRCELVAIDETPNYCRVIGDKRDYEIIETNLEEDILEVMNEKKI